MATTENKDTEQKIIEAARQVFLEKVFSEMEKGCNNSYCTP